MTSRESESAAPRPQSLMLSFFGIHALGRDTAVSSGSVIEVFARVGVGQDAVRSTLARMVTRGLLERHKVGRKAYFGLTPRATAVLADGQDRIRRAGTADGDWDGSWTLVGFSLPESWRSERHDLRSRLVWGGFGPLQSGLWLAPGRVDVAALVDGLGLERHLKVFHASAAAPTGPGELVGAAFDLDAVAAGYRAFLERWGPGRTPAADDLGCQLLLHTDWLGVVRSSPYLPAEHLPDGWPAARAAELFRTLSDAYEPGAQRIAEATLDRITPPGALGAEG